MDHLIQDGITGLYVCGSTGEGPSLTTEERKAVAKAYVEAAAGRIPVIVHVGHDSLEEARTLAQHAAEIGADALAAMPPAYFKSQTADDLVAALAHIASGAESVPFFYYHIPALNGYNFSMVELLEKAPEHIPSFAGLKYSSTDLAEFRACLNVDGGRFEVLFGVDEMLLGAVATGAKGAVGSTYNFAAPLYRAILQAFADGDMEKAQQYQGYAVEMVRILVRYRGQPGIKAMMEFIGLDCGPNRLPMRTLTAEERSSLRREMEESGLLDRIRGVSVKA